MNLQEADLIKKKAIPKCYLQYDSIYVHFENDIISDTENKLVLSSG